MPTQVASDDVPSRQFARRLAWGAALLVVLVAGLAGLSLYGSYGNYHRNALVSARNLSQTLAQDLRASFGKVDLTLRTVQDVVERQGGIATDAGLNAQLARQAARLPEISSLAIADAEGRVVHGVPRETPDTLNVAERRFFRALRDDAQSQLVVSEPLRFRDGGEWVIVLARRLHPGDGTFGGVVYAALPLQQFQKKFATLDLGARGAVSLRDLDLGTVVRHPEPANLGTAIGNRTFSREWPEKLKEDPVSGTYFAVGLDGRNRALAYQRVGPYPFYLIVGLFPGDYLAAWRTEAWKTLLLVALFAVVVVAFSGAIRRLWKQREADSRRLLAISRSALRQSEEQLQLALESASMGVWIAVPATGEFRLDPEGRRLHEMGAREPATLDAVLAHVHPDDRAVVKALADPRGPEGEPVDVELRVERRDGGWRWVSWRGRLLPATRETPERVIGVVQDITPQKDAERRQKIEAQRKDEFVATLAHELRNPLAPIRNAVEIMRLRPSADAQMGQLRDIIERQTRQMTRLVDDLLDIARIGGGAIPLRLERVDLAAVVLDASDAARPLIDAGQHELSVAMAQEPLTLVADPTRLTQMILNLLNNAAKYTPRGGRISLAVSREGDEVVIAVRDNGNGISAEQLPRIFDIFYQAAPAAGRTTSGLGIGLSLVRTLAALHGGSVVAHSEGIGLGAEFILRLPLSGPHASAPREQAAAGADAGRAGG